MTEVLKENYLKGREVGGFSLWSVRHCCNYTSGRQNVLVWGQRAEQIALLRGLRIEKPGVLECLSGAHSQVTKLPSIIPHLLRVLPPLNISKDYAIGLEDVGPQGDPL